MLSHTHTHHPTPPTPQQVMWANGLSYKWVLFQVAIGTFEDVAPVGGSKWMTVGVRSGCAIAFSTRQPVIQCFIGISILPVILHNANDTVPSCKRTSKSQKYCDCVFRMSYLDDASNWQLFFGVFSLNHRLWKIHRAFYASAGPFSFGSSRPVNGVAWSWTMVDPGDWTMILKNTPWSNVCVSFGCVLGTLFSDTSFLLETEPSLNLQNVCCPDVRTKDFVRNRVFSRFEEARTISRQSVFHPNIPSLDMAWCWMHWIHQLSTA